jgi:hypothetical protein
MEENQVVYEEAQRRYTALNWAIGLSGENGVLKTVPEITNAAAVFYNFIINGPPQVVIN